MHAVQQSCGPIHVAGQSLSGITVNCLVVKKEHIRKEPRRNRSKHVMPIFGQHFRALKLNISITSLHKQLSDPWTIGLACHLLLWTAVYDQNIISVYHQMTNLFHDHNTICLDNRNRHSLPLSHLSAPCEILVWYWYDVFKPMTATFN